MDPSGKEKEPIVQRILGGDTVTTDIAEEERPAASKNQPPKVAKFDKPDKKNGGHLGFEAKLWQAADKLRSNMDAAEYKHVVLGLIFLKYISDAFEERTRACGRRLTAPTPRTPTSTAPTTSSGCPRRLAGRISRTTPSSPPSASWSTTRWCDRARQPDAEGGAAEGLRSPCARQAAARRAHRPHRHHRLGDAENRTKDILGRVYEYFLAQFASAEGKKGGQFYTPQCVVRVLVEMLARTRVASRSLLRVGRHVRPEREVRRGARRPRRGHLASSGRSRNHTTWRLAKMNLAIRGIDADIGWSRRRQLPQGPHQDLKADFVLANPPFNDSDWGGERLRDDVRWKYGVPPVGNANFAWVQHFLHHLAPTGTAGFVLANGSMSSNQSGEGDIRRAIVEADLVDCMVALPGQLFYSTQIPVFVVPGPRQEEPPPPGPAWRDAVHRRSEGGVDDRPYPEGVDRLRHRSIAGTYHAWRGDQGAAKYEDEAGFCKAAKVEEVSAQRVRADAGRYVGAEDIEDDGEPFEERFPKLVAKLEEDFANADALTASIRSVLARLRVAR